MRTRLLVLFGLILLAAGCQQDPERRALDELARRIESIEDPTYHESMARALGVTPDLRAGFDGAPPNPVPLDDMRGDLRDGGDTLPRRIRWAALRPRGPWTALARTERDRPLVMIACPECGNQVSSVAAACPTCGASPKPRSSNTRRVLVGVASAGVLWLALEYLGWIPTILLVVFGFVALGIYALLHVGIRHLFKR